MSRPAPGDLVSGKYRIERLIGDGGMGVVYEARHEGLGSKVALKFLHAELAKRPGLSQRFQQEARVSAAIQSVHVTHVTDVDTAEDGSPYLVMELLTGESLQTVLDRLGKLPQDQAVDFALQILAGLEAAHATGVVHRDLKPDNVFVTPSSGGPLLKLIDFGIAKLRASSEYNKGLTRAGVVMGTPEYMAPEQLFSAADTDHRADIYSLGVILFEMLSGLRPADGEDAEVIVAAVDAGRVRKLRQLQPSVPEGLALLVERATSAKREGRPESASELRLALASFAGQLSHAGRLAAVAEPLLPLSPAPPPSALVSLRSVPRTLPPDGPPLSVSQLGAARTSLSEGEPVMSRAPAATAAAVVQRYAAPAVVSALAVVSPPARRSRAGALVFAALLVVMGGAGAVGYAAYHAADHDRDRPPPLPDAGPPGQVSVSPLDADGNGTTAEPGTTPTPPGPRPTSPTRPGIPGRADAGAPSPGPVLQDGGKPPPFQLPFPLPSGLVLPSSFPTSLPSGLQLPSGFPTAFPPGFPGLPQQRPAQRAQQPAAGGGPVNAGK